VDSIAAVEVHTAMERSLRMRLPATLVFDYPTVNAVVAYLTHQSQSLESR
jgi:polyene macrolide polyketide synthase